MREGKEAVAGGVQEVGWGDQSHKHGRVELSSGLVEERLHQIKASDMAEAAASQADLMRDLQQGVA